MYLITHFFQFTKFVPLYISPPKILILILSNGLTWHIFLNSLKVFLVVHKITRHVFTVLLAGKYYLNNHKHVFNFNLFAKKYQFRLLFQVNPFDDI